MKILIYCVNYFADRELRAFLNSIDTALDHCVPASAEVAILDNSCRSERELCQFESELPALRFPVKMIASRNNGGYFAGLSQAQSMINNHEVVIYCNPDIQLSDDFFSRLIHHVSKSEKGVVAPAIICMKTGRDQNPKYNTRIKKAKLERLLKIYSNQFLFAAFTLASLIFDQLTRFRKRSSVQLKNSLIYAPHGAIFIFSDIEFFANLRKFDCFLFGEEIFIAEEARAFGLQVQYEPAIKVFDQRHGSIKLLSLKKLQIFYRDSIAYLLKNYDF